MRLASMTHAVDLHCCGEPGRVIVGGVRDVPANTMFEKKNYLETKADDLRQRMLREPRGYLAANCDLINTSWIRKTLFPTDSPSGIFGERSKANRNPPASTLHLSVARHLRGCGLVAPREAAPPARCRSTRASRTVERSPECQRP